MYLKSIELLGFKSFAKKSEFIFSTPVTAIVGPNGSGKSNVAESFRFVLGEQSMKSLRGKRGEDLIFNGGLNVARGNRAAVKVTFDNKKRLLDLDFDEVSIERIVHRDGTNEYVINGSKVRLKDVIELLAKANIGASGHHIISQGEADRVLSANPKERREMLMDALGLKVYQYKKEESLKKLEKTEENKKQVLSLKKENAPHLRFLEKQVARIEKAKDIREELKEKYLEYLKRESLYLKHEEERIARERKEPQQELDQLEEERGSLRQTIESSEQENPETKKLLEIEQRLSEVRKEREEVARKLGQLEGQIMFEERRAKEAEQEDSIAIPFSEVEALGKEVEKAVEGYDGSGIEALLSRIKEKFSDLFGRYRGERKEVKTNLPQLLSEKEDLTARIKNLEEEGARFEREYRDLQQGIEEKKDESRQAERRMFEIATRQGELRSTLQTLERDGEDLARAESRFKQELTEAGVLVGRVIHEYESYSVALESVQSEQREQQEKRQRDLEKLKVRLEELGGAHSEEIMKEYNEVKERDEFLEREVNDLTESVESLKNLIEELEQELNQKFQEGIKKINSEFSELFALMFGGGTAGLSVVSEKKKRRSSEEDEEEDDEKIEEGVDISVSLPKKKVKGLMMLSGGERALTSIALIFAMSSVNPPPFLILDETDAALDEANSRRYGDMIESLAKRSQLIVITHNRETMSRAGVLYGVTMDADGISKLLSVKFEEAVAVAK